MAYHAASTTLVTNAVFEQLRYQFNILNNAKLDLEVQEDGLVKRAAAFKRAEKALIARERHIAEKGQTIARLATVLKKKSLQTTSREVIVKKITTTLVRRQTKLKAMENSLRNELLEHSTRSEDLHAKGENLAEREEELRDREAAVGEECNKLHDVEADMIQCDNALGQWMDDMATHERHLEAKEQALTAVEKLLDKRQIRHNRRLAVYGRKVGALHRLQGRLKRREEDISRWRRKVSWRHAKSCQQRSKRKG